MRALKRRGLAVCGRSAMEKRGAMHLMWRTIKTVLFFYAALAIAAASEFSRLPDPWAAKRAAATKAYISRDYAEAERRGREALQLASLAGGKAIAVSACDLGLTLWAETKYAESAEQFEHALAIRQKTGVPNDPDLAASYNNLGATYYLQGKYSEAEKL
jgi:tetratricopeptide (TPR) repeat protein